MNLKQLLRPAVEALKHYGLPFLLIQICAGFIVFAYYHSPIFQSWCAHAARWKTEGGFFFSAWSTVIAGAFLPEIAKFFTGKFAKKVDAAWWRNFSFIIFLFIIEGIGNDILFRAQGVIFGYNLNFSTLASKVLFDQFIWCPLAGIPSYVLLFTWREERFNLISTFRRYTPSFYKARVLPLLITAWLYWFPIVIFIYAMPAALQFCLFLCATAAWSLLMVFIAQSQGAGKASGCGGIAALTH
ncbi:MAG: hypothetical protein ACOY3I_04685 [Verrucomicrobiota bacterium]